MSQLILLRHGQSEWNKQNLFTGWVDIPLSKEGIDESFRAGKLIHDIPIDIIITSTLMRAQMTAMLAMIGHSSGKTPVILHTENPKLSAWETIYSEKTQATTIPVICAWEINERMYGKLQGLNKAETIEKYGADQVQQWRRSYDTRPPEGESLAMTANRSIPYFSDVAIPFLQKGKNILICAHGNSLRSIIMHLDNLTKEQVIHLELATGVPIKYTFENNTFVKEE